MLLALFVVLLVLWMLGFFAFHVTLVQVAEILENNL
jgi:hypothetical protein